MLQRALNGHAPQSMMPNRFPFGQPQFHQQQQQSSQLSPMAMQNLVTETQNNEMWLKCLQMSNQMSAAQRANVKKPGATVKPMRREPNKVSPTTSMDNRTDKKDSIEGCKQEPNASDAEHLHQILTCANI
jgi:carboxypeptidase C (cathepsin A)